MNQLRNLLLFGTVEALIEGLGLIEEARASAEEGSQSRRTSNEASVVPLSGARPAGWLGNLEKAGHYLRELPGRLVAGGLNDLTQPCGRTRSRR